MKPPNMQQNLSSHGKEEIIAYLTRTKILDTEIHSFNFRHDAAVTWSATTPQHPHLCCDVNDH
ncbi:hypothetical protein E2C01_066249 [Portunus trituberculatus]|uniref:Uncharacterized protein n=1 Tax=Portunus trituberculatus TaxID=210409 RepID=A0A5B7HRT5_PORTR|nr:hypothetical protein [Portunus trituberculatus]